MNEQLPTTVETDGQTTNAPMVTTAPTHAAGWYPDPYGEAELRYYDGAAWTGHRHDPSLPAPPQSRQAANTGQQIIVNTYVAQSAGGGGSEAKSPVLAFILTFFFGPLGMLYSTVAGGLVMLLLDIILIPLTFGLVIPILWPIQLVWAVVAASNQNKRAAGNANAGPAAGGQANQVW